jgi:hypothetical protein
METKNLQQESETTTSELLDNNNRIKVRAVMSCPSCSYRKSFKNTFNRSDIETMVVSLKVFDWLSCPSCGEMLKMSLEFEI